MGEADLIDLIPRNSKKEQTADNEVYHFDDEVFSPGRTRVNDYKHSSKTLNKANQNISENTTSQRAEKKAYLNLSDEKIVWAGAIFVFFGIFLFFIGYWVGKTTFKDIAEVNKPYQQKVEETLAQKKVENEVAANPSPTTDAVKPIIITPPPAAAGHTGITESLPKVNEITPPAGNMAKSTETKGIKLKAVNTAGKTTQTDGKNTKISAEGNFTIQISAHTSMDKARSVEDELRKLGFQSYLVEATVNGITYYRVRAGKFSLKEEAQTALKKIQGSEIGKDSYILNMK